MRWVQFIFNEGKMLKIKDLLRMSRPMLPVLCVLCAFVSFAQEARLLSTQRSTQVLAIDAIGMTVEDLD